MVDKTKRNTSAEEKKTYTPCQHRTRKLSCCVLRIQIFIIIFSLLLKNENIDTITKFGIVLLVIMGLVLFLMETVMDSVGLYWYFLFL